MRAPKLRKLRTEDLTEAGFSGLPTALWSVCHPPSETDHAHPVQVPRSLAADLHETALTMMVRDLVEIDYGPHCRGVWLDRGELDKLNDRSMAMSPVSPPACHAQSQADIADSDHPGRPLDHSRRRKSWLSDLFD